MKNAVAFTTARRDGNARAASRLAHILKSRRVPGRIATAEQVHGTRIVVVPALKSPRKYPSADGLLSAAAGQPLGIFTADCVPIFIEAPAQRIIGALHAGWRGVQGHILGRALGILRRRWGVLPRDVHLRTGPSIGPCCFEVRSDVAKYFPASRRRRGDRWVVDLPDAVRRQARQLGIPAKQIAVSAACTRHQRRFYSYRRDATDERQISVIFQR